MAIIDQKKFLASIKKGLTLGTKALSLYQLFGFRERPFKEDLIERNSYLFVPPQLFYEHSQSLASWITACHSAGKNGLIIGPPDVGKSTLAKFFVEELVKLAEEIRIKSHYIQLKGLTEASETKQNPEEVVIGSPHSIGLIAELQNRNLTETETDILLIDDIEIGLRKENFIDELLRYMRSENQTIIGITTPSVPSELIDIFDDVYKIKSIEFETIVRILKTRILYYKENDDKRNNTSDLTPFTDTAINKIAEYSIGLPGLALDLADSCLRGIDDFNAKEITTEIVDIVAEELQYPIAKDIEMGQAISYIEVEGGEKKRKELNLTNPKTSILKEILFQSRVYPERPGITNKKLTNSKRISIQAHTISYHTNILERCKILEVQEGQKEKKRGKYRYFHIRKPIMNAIELKILSQKPPTSSEVIVKR